MSGGCSGPTVNGLEELGARGAELLRGPVVGHLLCRVDGTLNTSAAELLSGSYVDDDDGVASNRG